MPSKNKEQTEFWINVIVDEGVDEFGRKYRKTQWKKQDKSIELGSINNPKNKNIIGFEWKEKSPIEKMFGMFDN